MNSNEPKRKKRRPVYTNPTPAVYPDIEDLFAFEEPPTPDKPLNHRQKKVRDDLFARPVRENLPVFLAMMQLRYSKRDVIDRLDPVAWFKSKTPRILRLDRHLRIYGRTRAAALQFSAKGFFELLEVDFSDMISKSSSHKDISQIGRWLMGLIESDIDGRLEVVDRSVQGRFDKRWLLHVGGPIIAVEAERQGWWQPTLRIRMYCSDIHDRQDAGLPDVTDLFIY